MFNFFINCVYAYSKPDYESTLVKVSKKLNNIAKEASMLLNEDNQNASVTDQVDTSDAYIQLKVNFVLTF